MTGKLLNKDTWSLIYITALTVAALLYGFSTIPSPSQQRDIKLDHERVSDLGQLNFSINEYYTNHEQLPKSLDELTDNAYAPGTPLIKEDPVTHQQYEYIITSLTSYKLCATFASDSTKEAQYAYDEDNYNYSSFSDNFKHGKGHICFIKTVPPAITPIGGDGGGSNTRIPMKTIPTIYEISPEKPASPPAR